MKVQQFIKKLNNTELGRTGIHETYVLIPQNTNIPEMFQDFVGQQLNFFDRITGQYINSIRFTSDREFRMVGLGNYYRINHFNAGDEILFERRDNNEGTVFFIDACIKQNIVLFQRKGRGFEILNPDRIKITNGLYETIANFKEEQGLLKIMFKEFSRKRTDSPTSTNFYDLIFNGSNIFHDYLTDDMLELEIYANGNHLKKVTAWKKYEFNWEEKYG